MARSPTDLRLDNIDMSRKKLEKNFRRETSHPSRASWQVLKPLNTSDDPYVAGETSKIDYRGRKPHKELQKRTPKELVKIGTETKLYKPFKSESHRTLEA